MCTDSHTKVSYAIPLLELLTYFHVFFELSKLTSSDPGPNSLMYLSRPLSILVSPRVSCSLQLVPIVVMPPTDPPQLPPWNFHFHLRLKDPIHSHFRKSWMIIGIVKGGAE